MTRVLMCPPTYYGIEYQINPWMAAAVGADRELSQKQWDQLYNLLTLELNFQVETIEPQPGLPDMVFTANGGLVFDGQVIISRFLHPQRRPEASFFREWFQDRGYRVHTLPDDMVFEGAGDAVFCGENLFGGYRFRSEARCYSMISDLTGFRILPVELRDPRFYHLDTCFCPLGPSRAIYYPGAFDTYGNRVLEHYVAELIQVTREEALRFACNAVVGPGWIVLSQGSPTLVGELKGLGYQVYELDVSEFIKAGGSVRCLTLAI